MKANEFIRELQKLVKEHGDLELVFSADQEGNSFEEVYFHPSAGVYGDYEYTALQDMEEEVKPTHFCIT